MLRNYINIAFRSLLKNKVFSFINIFGLAIGMAAFLFIIQYVRFERSYESYNPHADNLYRITIDFYNQGEYVVTDCETHAPMGPLIKDKLPEAQNFVRMFHYDGLVNLKVGGEKFLEEQQAYYADPSVFDLFSLSVLHGDGSKALINPFQVVLTASMAKKYFGREDAVGESMQVDGDVYQVTAVIKDVPPNSHLKFSMLFSHASIAKINQYYKEDNWSGNNEYTYLLLAPGVDLAVFNAKLKALCESIKTRLGGARYVAEPVRSIHLYSNKTYEPEVNGNARTVYFLLVIAVFIIVIAWVNYVNLSTARAMERAREVGIRKVMGSLKLQLILQFLAESVMVNILAGMLAFVLFHAGLPLFHYMSGQPETTGLLMDSSFWLLFAVLLLIGSVLSGLYPAFMLSSFQPATVLKGKFRSSAHGQYLRTGLVIFQFGATVVLIVCMLTVYLQIRYMRAYDLGMDLDQTFVVRAPQVKDSVLTAGYRAFKTELLRRPEVKQVASSGSLPGLSLHELSSTSFRRYGDTGDGKGYEYYYFSVDESFVPTLGMRMAAGRNFEGGVRNEDQVIVNEETVKRLGYARAEDAISTKITFRTRGEAKFSTIIGVIQNFYQRSPKEKHIPMLFQYRETADFFSMRLNTTDMRQTVASVKETWDKVFPDTPFHYFFLDERFAQQYRADQQFGQIITSFSVLAVFIACLGLFGLSSYTILQRTKEIGIRKVLGASVAQIVRLLSKDFARIVMLAALLALPVAYYAMQLWLSNYAVRISLNIWVFVIPVVSILLIAFVTVSFQTIKTALSNPTDSLKNE